MNKVIKVISVEDEGETNCNHIWCCNPMNKMTIEKNKMVFTYDRICKNCLRKETIKSNRKGENIRKYKDLL